MAKKKRIPKLTREERERWARTTRMLEERIAYHEAKAREEDERRARPSQPPAAQEASGPVIMCGCVRASSSVATQSL
jgi:hypothetical protein